MSYSTVTGTPHNEFVCVALLVNSFIATHINGNEKTFISEHPETDLKTAQATAKVFAEAHNIPFDDTLRAPNPPIITVLKFGQDWFPAELHADKIRLLTGFGPINLGGSQQQAVKRANVIALSKKADFLPQIGISMAEQKPPLDN